jgi:DNA-directed RNA polymerase I, II, and III subunit RPABC2
MASNYKNSKNTKNYKSNKFQKTEHSTNKFKKNTPQFTNGEIPELEIVPKVPSKKYGNTPTLSREIIYKLPEDRVTSEIMTKFEYCEAISIRAKQIEDGGQVFTEIGELTDPIEIAKKEILDKRCPLSIIRHITPNIAEEWHINEMETSENYVNVQSNKK